MSSIRGNHKNIIIIGGGVFGLTIGWYLARAGQPVTIFEKGQVGRGATWAAAGMLMPWKLSKNFSADLFALQQESHKLWPAFARRLSAHTDVDIQYQTDGRYFVAMGKKGMKRFEKQYHFHRQIGFPLEWLSGAEARRREPAFGPNVVAAIFTPLAHRVDNRQLIRAVRQAFLQAGGTLREHTPVREILTERNQVRGVQLSQKTVPGRTVILAAGAWSGQIEGLPPSLQATVRPRKGQTLTLQMAANKPLLSRPVIGPVYLVPRADGRLVVGTTVEREAGFDTAPTAGGVFHILRKAGQILPDIKNLPLVEIGAGLRPTGPNRLPVLGPTGVEGLIAATGGHSYGILLSPVVAQAISRLVCTGQTPEAIKPFAPR